MFAKLPQTLTAPFGLLTDEAKLAFRSRPQGISQLYTTRHIAETDSYWDQYFTLFDTPSDVFSLISTHDIRRALLDSPENVATLIRVVTSRLFNLVSDHTFPSIPPTSVASYATSFMKTSSTERNATKEVLNSLRVLQRVLPVVFEVEGESNSFELEVLWKKVQVDEDEIVPTAPEQAPQFVIEDDDDGSESGHGSNTQSQIPQLKRTKTLPSLGEKLFTCVNDLLFCCGFSLPTKIQVDHYKINYVIWEKGVGSTTDSGPNHAYDSNKTEVLRLLLVLLSRQIYIPPAALFTHPSFYTLHVVRKTPRRDVLTLLCSLLNTVMNSPTTNNMTIASVAGKVPYNHLVFKGEDSRTALVGMCLQVLSRDIVSDSGDTTSSSPTAQTNAFRYFLAKLHRTQDFAFILSGIIAILEQQLAISNNLLPGSRRSVPYVPETIVLFWKIIELNKKFRAYLLDSNKSVDVLAYLLCYSLEIKDKPQQHGLCRALSYIIQTLSAESAFGNKLSSPINIQVPTKWVSQGASHGTAGDFMITSVYSIIATTSGSLNSIYPALIIALANAAPYFKNLSVIASNRLLQLFTSFSNPLFLLSDESHPRLLFLMLEVFNSVVFHHLSDNPNLLYAIITAQKTFEELGTFTLTRGLREIQRVQRIKEEQASQAEHDRKDGPQQERVSVESAHQEKSRLLRNESDPAFTIESTSFSGEDLEAGLGGHEQTETRPLTSLPSENSPTTSTSTITAASEKARGKMKARRSLSSDTINGDRMAAAGIGRNGFLPTQEWCLLNVDRLPLDTVMLVISELLPKIQNLQAGRQKANSAGAITDFLQSVTLTDVLPPAPVLYPRRFVWSDASIVWLTSLIWGGVYVHGMSPLGIWNSTNVQLFFVKHTQPQQRQITDTMSSVVGGLFSPTRQRLERSSNQ
ncbi:high-temperature-induced dauer-formation protein-domain-containing protein [Suillus discolor]|uniref:High-temperature-induced dauer-formation protein-domain-containing protein n=1 Tax=Suillus discolor TaxID=1912936 RepID=A0A9P7FFP2_9AGAM|nr:high-temperature-induced dauer-formation protein-domain-containing protein [Suillus discolor]KAG2115361.1 high-temperature-induced dauer-formation protein-domain-containing protein [Suillus discolor]